MKLLLVRHGHNAGTDVVGGLRGCKGLSPLGREQAHTLRDRLADEGAHADVLVSSPLARASQTRDIIATALSPGAVEEDCDLCEVHPGVADGMDIARFTQRYPPFDMAAQPDRVVAPGGDSWRTFMERVGRALDSLASTHAGASVVVVTHAGVVAAAMIHIFGIPRPGTGAVIQPDFTSITEWALADGRWRLERYNDLAHLDLAGIPRAP